MNAFIIFCALLVTFNIFLLLWSLSAIAKRSDTVMRQRERKQ